MQNTWVLTLLARASALCLAFLLSFFLVREFGAQRFGIYMKFYAAVFVASLIGRRGMSLLVVRELSKSESGFNLTSLLKVVHFRVLVSTILVSIILFTAAVLINKAPVSFIWLGVLAAVSFSINVINSESFRGVGNPVLSIFFQGLLLPFIFLSVLILISRFGFNPDLESVFVLAVIVTSMISCILVYCKIIREDSLTGCSADYSNFKESVSYLWPISILEMAAHRFFPVFIIGYFGRPSDIAEYTVAFQIAALVSFSLMASNTFAMPMYSRLAIPGREFELRGLIKRVYLVNAAFGFTVALIIGVFSDVIMSLYSKEFVDAGPILLMLCIGQIFNVIGGHSGSLLAMTHNDRPRSLSAYVGYIGFIILSCILVKDHGAYGVAIAFVVSNFTISIMSNFLLYKHAGVRGFL